MTQLNIIEESWKREFLNELKKIINSKKSKWEAISSDDLVTLREID